MALQAITIPDDRFDAYVRGVDFIQKYVFPGGCLPSMAAMERATRQATDLQLRSQHDFADDYARTLRCWSDSFEARFDDVRRIMPSTTFHRIWHYYFAYCEAGFREKLIGLKQLLFAKPVVV